MTLRSFLLLVITAFFVLAGLALRQGSLIALAFPLWFYVLFAYQNRPNGINLEINRSFETKKVFSGSLIEGSTTILNQGGAAEEIQLDLPMPAGLSGDDYTRSYTTSLTPQESFTADFRLKGPRGDYRFPQGKAIITDTFAAYRIERALMGVGQVAVLPRHISVSGLKIHPPHTRGFAGPIPSRQAGSGLDFLLVREYHPGDSLRQVNWKRSARSDRDLYTTTYEQHRIADAGIILDARQQSDIKRGGLRLFEYAVQAAGGICEELLAQGNRVGLLVYGASMVSAFPGTGKRQLEKIRQVLARAQTGFSYALEKLDYLPTRFFAPRSQIILISPISSADIPVLVSLRHNGYAVLVISPNPILFDAEGRVASARDQLALRAALAERQLMINLLRRNGVIVVDWDVEKPLAGLLMTLPMLEGR